MMLFQCYSKIIELEEELKVVSNNMKSLEIAEQEARHLSFIYFTLLVLHPKITHSVLMKDSLSL